MPSVRSRGERVSEAVALSAVGGFLDAYTYLAHGGVFANAQTGNVVLFGIEATGRHWAAAGRHMLPIAAFLLGMATVEVLARARAARRFPALRHPGRLVLGVECGVFLVVGLLPAATPDMVVTVLIAWAATLQVGTFRTVRDASYNATFTTGNLRSVVGELAGWLVDRDRRAGSRARALGAVVLAFAAGAVLGGLAVRWLHTHAVLLTVPVLLVVLVAVVRGTRRIELAAQYGRGPDGSSQRVIQ